MAYFKLQHDFKVEDTGDISTYNMMAYFASHIFMAW